MRATKKVVETLYAGRKNRVELVDVKVGGKVYPVVLKTTGAGESWYLCREGKYWDYDAAVWSIRESAEKGQLTPGTKCTWSALVEILANLDKTSFTVTVLGSGVTPDKGLAVVEHLPFIKGVRRLLSSMYDAGWPTRWDQAVGDDCLYVCVNKTPSGESRDTLRLLICGLRAFSTYLDGGFRIEAIGVDDVGNYVHHYGRK